MPKHKSKKCEVAHEKEIKHDTYNCTVLRCHNLAMEGRLGCENHMCRCGVYIKMDSGNGCKYCKCRTIGCPMLASNEYYFCEQHGCAKCHNREICNNSRLCQQCKCTVSGCPCPKMENSKGCAFHTCKRCGIAIKSGFYTDIEKEELAFRARYEESQHSQDFYDDSQYDNPYYDEMHLEIKKNHSCTDFCDNCKCKNKECPCENQLENIENKSEYCIAHTCKHCKKKYTDNQYCVSCKCVLCDELRADGKYLCTNHLCENCHNNEPDCTNHHKKYRGYYCSNTDCERYKYCEKCKCKGNFELCENKITEGTQAAEHGLCENCLCPNCSVEPIYLPKKYCKKCVCYYCDKLKVLDNACQDHICSFCNEKIVFESYFAHKPHIYCLKHTCNFDWKSIGCKKLPIEGHCFCEDHLCTLCKKDPFKICEKCSFDK